MFHCLLSIAPSHKALRWNCSCFLPILPTPGRQAEVVKWTGRLCVQTPAAGGSWPRHKGNTRLQHSVWLLGCLPLLAPVSLPEPPSEWEYAILQLFHLLLRAGITAAPWESGRKAPILPQGGLYSSQHCFPAVASLSTSLQLLWAGMGSGVPAPPVTGSRKHMWRGSLR